MYMLAIETAVGGSGLLGYIKAHKPELKMRDYEVYRGVYCSLCKRMGRRYTPAAQLLLSYDFAFFALLKMSVHPEVSIFTESRCPYNPFVRCKKCVGDPGGVLDLCADAAVITAFYKLKDDLKDSGFTKRLRALVFLPAVLLMFLKAKRRVPAIHRIVSDAMVQQAQVEKTQDVGVDASAQPTAAAMAALAGYKETDASTKMLLERLGYLLGRWVYIADAADDCRDDRQKGNFNPFSGVYEKAAERGDLVAFLAKVSDLLNMTAGEATATFELLDVHRYKDLLENILYEGLAEQTRQILAKYKEV